jgi:hypothetical protein
MRNKGAEQALSLSRNAPPFLSHQSHAFAQPASGERKKAVGEQYQCDVAVKAVPSPILEVAEAAEPFAVLVELFDGPA